MTEKVGNHFYEFFLFIFFFSDLFEPHEGVEAGNAGQNGTDYVINTNNGVQA